MEKVLRAFDKKFLRFISGMDHGWDLIEFTEEGFTLNLTKRNGVKMGKGT